MNYFPSLQGRDHCGHEHTGHISGRTLRRALRNLPEKHPLRRHKVAGNGWVEVCPICHDAVLRSTTTSWPYRNKDGVMCTVGDFDRVRGCYVSEVFDFASFLHTGAALSAAIDQQKHDAKTIGTEKIGASLLASIEAGRATESDIFEFSQAVHDWGGGQRVWGKLPLYHGRQLGATLAQWLLAVPSSSDALAIEKGTEIKGLDVSFASKHLRMLQPERFSVLDGVLSGGLGYALNPRGYQLFMRHLRLYQQVHQTVDVHAELTHLRQ